MLLIGTSGFQFADWYGPVYPPGLPPFTPLVTSSLGYFRFHGRNPQWFNPAQRYNYEYSPQVSYARILL